MGKILQCNAIIEYILQYTVFYAFRSEIGMYTINNDDDNNNNNNNKKNK